MSEIQAESLALEECSPWQPEASEWLRDFMEEDWQSVCFDTQADILRAEEGELLMQQESEGESPKLSEAAQSYLDMLKPFEGLEEYSHLSWAILEAEQEVPWATCELCWEAFAKAKKQPEIIESYLRTTEDKADWFAQLHAFKVHCERADRQEGNEIRNRETQEKVEESAREAEKELAALKSDPENQKMLALIESIKEIDPERYEELKTKGMKSEGEVFQKEAWNSQLSMKRLEKEENAGAATLERIALETQLQNAEKLLKNGEEMKGLLEGLAMREGWNFEGMSEDEFAETQTGQFITQVREIARSNPQEYGASLAAVDNFMLSRGPAESRARIHADRTGLVAKSMLGGEAAAHLAWREPDVIGNTLKAWDEYVNLRTGEKRIGTESGNLTLKTNGPDFEKYDLPGMEAKLSALREAAQALDADIAAMKEDLRVEMQRLENIDPDENLVEEQNYERQERIIEELEAKLKEAETEYRSLAEQIAEEESQIIKIEAKMREATEKADMTTRMDLAYLSAMGFDALAPADAEYLFTEIERASQYHWAFPFDLTNGPRFSDTDTPVENRLPAFQDLMMSIMATPEYSPESNVRVSIESELGEIIPMEQKDAHAMWRDCGLIDDGGTFQREVFQERVQALWAQEKTK